MSGFDKVVASYEEALAGIADCMTIIAGGFGLCGIPENLIAALREHGARFVTMEDAALAFRDRENSG